MTEFFAITTSLPAAPFALALLASLAYWVVALVGGLDLTGGAEGLDGVADAAVDGVAEAALDGVADGVLDGAADAGTEAAVEAVGDTSLLASALRLGRVPVTIQLSLFAVWGWLFAFGAGWSLRHPLAGVLPGWLGAGLGLAGATAAAFVLAGVTSRPLEPLFKSHHGRRRDSLLGETAEVTTSRVDRRFGQGRVVLGGDEHVVQIRNDSPDNGLTRGARALLVAFDADREAWVVEPERLAPRVSQRSLQKEG
jgi:hypothetical protein